MSSLNKTEVLHVNLSTTLSPFFDNFYIYKWTDKIVNNKTLVNAYHIEIKDQDLRYFLGEQEDTMYEAWHVGGNQVLVKQPGGPYSFMKAATEEETAKKDANYDEKRSMERDAVVRNNYIGDHNKKFKYTLLEFKEESGALGLNNDVFSPQSENGKIIGIPAPSKATFTIKTGAGPKTVSSLRCAIIWDIAIVEKKPRYKSAAQPKKNELDALVSSAFNSMEL